MPITQPKTQKPVRVSPGVYRTPGKAAQPMTPPKGGNIDPGFNVGNKGVGNIPGPASDPAAIGKALGNMAHGHQNVRQQVGQAGRFGGNPAMAAASQAVDNMQNNGGQPQGGAAAGGAPQPGGLSPREQQRLAYLQKTRPNDKQVKQLLAKQQQGGGGQAGGQEQLPYPDATSNPDQLAANTGDVYNQDIQNLGTSLDNMIAPPDQAHWDQERQGNVDANVKLLTRGLDDQQKQEQAQMEEKLANQGIPVGSDVYNQQLGNLSKKYDYQREDARNQAVSNASADMLRNATTQGTETQTQTIAPTTYANIGGTLGNVFDNMKQLPGQINQNKATTKLIGAQTRESNARAGALGRRRSGGQGNYAPTAFE